MHAFGYLLTASLLLVGLLAGCAKVPLAGPAADADGKRFDPPTQGQSALYLYRDAPLGSEVAFSLSDNQQPIGTLADKTWLRLDLAPGRHMIGCTGVNSQPTGQGTTNELGIDLGPGENSLHQGRGMAGSAAQPAVHCD